MTSKNETGPDSRHFTDPVSSLVLRIIGTIIIVMAAAFVLTPVFVIERVVGYPSLLNPLFMYLLRTTGIVYVWTRASFLVASRKPGKYRLWIKTSAYMLLTLSATCLVSGFLYGMPTVLFIIDGSLCVLGSVVLFWISPDYFRE